MRLLITKLLAAVLVLFGALIPAVSNAQLDRILQNRQNKKNEWRNIALGSGAVALLGLLKHDSTLVFAGTAGALYSAWRYEQDRKSQSKLERTRAAYFSRSHFVRNGVRYNKRTVWRNGKKYYQFVRA